MASAHVSRTGGPTPGYRYCMDGAIGATAVPRDRWSVVGMSYDGGPGSSDFTVGAVHRSGEMGAEPSPTACGHLLKSVSL